MAKVYLLGSNEFAARLSEESRAGGDLEWEKLGSYERARNVVGKGGEAVLVIEWQPPDQRSLERIRTLLGQSLLPALVLGPDDPQSLVAALEAGAHEALPVSLSAREIAAHLRALLHRRRQAAAPAELRESITVGGLSIDPRRYEVRAVGQPLELTPREFDLLQHLAEHAGEACRRADLIEQVWGGEIEESSRSLDVHIGRLRAKLSEAGDCGVRIETVPAVGYRLDEAQPPLEG